MTNNKELKVLKQITESGNTLDALDELYIKLISKLSENHDLWVKSNFKMRSIESARTQIKTQGDIPADPALEILNEAYEREKHFNDRETQRLYARKDMIREIEVFANDHGKDWDGVYEIFGY